MHICKYVDCHDIYNLSIVNKRMCKIVVKHVIPSVKKHNCDDYKDFKYDAKLLSSKYHKRFSTFYIKHAFMFNKNIKHSITHLYQLHDIVSTKRVDRKLLEWILLRVNKQTVKDYLCKIEDPVCIDEIRFRDGYDYNFSLREYNKFIIMLKKIHKL